MIYNYRALSIKCPGHLIEFGPQAFRIGHLIEWTLKRERGILRPDVRKSKFSRLRRDPPPLPRSISAAQQPNFSAAARPTFSGHLIGFSGTARILRPGHLIKWTLNRESSVSVLTMSHLYYLTHHQRNCLNGSSLRIRRRLSDVAL